MRALSLLLFALPLFGGEPLTVDLPAGAIVISADGHRWKIDLAGLPYLPSDCMDGRCALREPTIEALDSKRDLVFFALVAGRESQNTPEVLFEADLFRKSVRRLLNAGSGLGDMMLSPDGRYLAYSVGFSSGVCHVTSSVYVADLGISRTASHPVAVASADQPNPYTAAKPVRWERGNRLVFHEGIFPKGNSCAPQRKKIRIVDVRSLSYAIGS